jgi:catechol 2,3-dioxygenase-like lactoylglutathione lyase family enzyme
MFNPMPMMFHPTVLVDSLDQTTEWFARVFNRSPVRWEEKWNVDWLNPTYPLNYSYFYVIADVCLDALCPPLLKLPDGKKAVYPEVRQLVDIAWYTDDIKAVSIQLEKHGFRTRNQEGAVIRNGDVPPSNMVWDCPMIWSVPDDTGLTYEFFEMARRHWRYYSEKGDPRLAASWEEGRLEGNDPLGIVRSAYHHILTHDRARAIRLYVDVLGGRIVDEGHDESFDSDYVTIAYAKSNLRFATPRNGSIADINGAIAKSDRYAGISFEIEDLEKAAAHLEAQRVPFERAKEGLFTDAAQTLGIRWGFCARKA